MEQNTRTETWLQEIFCKWKAGKAVDGYSKPRPWFRIYLDCEKMERTLSSNAQAFIIIKCFMNDIDVSGKMMRDEFEDLASPILRG